MSELPSPLIDFERPHFTQVTDGVIRCTIDLATIPELKDPEDTSHSAGEPSMLDFDGSEIDDYLRFVDAQGNLVGKVLTSAWYNLYKAGDEFVEHTDWSSPTKATTVIISLAGEGIMTFPRLGEELPLAPGDAVFLDGEINPEHSVKALTDRKALVALYM